MEKNESTKNWIDVPRKILLEDLPNKYNNNYTKIISIDETFSELSEGQIDKLLVPPLDHQKKLIKAMIDIENRQTIYVKEKNTTYIVQSRACILSDKPGSGKSYSIISLFILNRKLPTNPIFMEDESPNHPSSVLLQQSNSINNIIRTPKSSLPINLIFVSKNVLSQWVEYIERFSEGLGIVVIDKFSTAKKVIESFAENKKYFAHTDIVLIKNDKVNSKKGKIKHPVLEKISMENKSMVEIFSELIIGSDMIVDRVILDDFDSLLIPSSTKIIPAKFTWFVSATKGKYRAANDKNLYNNILRNNVLTTYFNLNSDQKFLMNSVKFCDVRIRQYKVEDGQSRYRNAIVQLNQNFSESINANSLPEIGNRLKITKENITIYDIFEKMYENEFKSYKKIKILHQRISRIKTYYNKVLLHKPQSKSNPDTIEFLKSLISDGKEEELRLKWTDFSNDVLAKYINTVLDTTEKNLDQKTISIKRVISNFQKESCPITFEDLKEGEICILKCCGIVLSKEGLNMTRNGLCPSCRAEIVDTNVLEINPNMLDISLEEDIENKEIEEETLPEKEEPKNLTKNEFDVDDLIGLMSGSITSDIPYDSEEIKNLRSFKYNAVLKLITQTESGLNQVGNQYYKVFGGGEYARLENRKFIIFASSSASIMSILYENPREKKGNRFSKYNISYAEVKGMKNKVAENIKRYRLPNSNSSSIKVLLITSKSTGFAGLDLQCTTDIIFLNKIKDANIEKQMIGRALRLGRTNKLDVHYLMYDNEIFELGDMASYF